MYWMLRELHAQVGVLHPDSAIPRELPLLKGWLEQSPLIPPLGERTSSSEERLRHVKRSVFLLPFVLISSPRQHKQPSRQDSQQPSLESLPQVTENPENGNLRAKVHSPQESIPRFHEGQYIHLNTSNNERIDVSFSMAASHSAPVIAPNDITYPQMNFDQPHYSSSNPAPNNYVSPNNDHNYHQYPTSTQYDHYNWNTGDNASHVNEQEPLPDHEMQYNPYYSPTEDQQNHPYGQQRQ
jgi:hypothetical protein